MSPVYTFIKGVENGGYHILQLKILIETITNQLIDPGWEMVTAHALIQNDCCINLSYSRGTSKRQIKTEIERAT